MKQLISSAIVAAIVSVLILQLDNRFDADDDVVIAPAPTTDTAAIAIEALPLSYTDDLIEDTWVNAARTPGADRRTLSNAANSICYLTKVEITGVQGPEDSNSCVIDVDDFTGHWELIATVEEGGQSEVRCNARCLIWE